MNTKELFQAFNTGLFWNGTLYGAYRLSSLALSFVLFAKLDNALYCSWITSMSCIYLTLAWLDCGLRKSITRYSHVFTSSAQTYGLFIIALFAFQVPLYALVGPRLLTTMTCALSSSSLFSVYLVPLLITEGLIGTFKLLFHAQFFIKQFNILGFFASYLSDAYCYNGNLVRLYRTVAPLVSSSSGYKYSYGALRWAPSLLFIGGKLFE